MAEDATKHIGKSTIITKDIVQAKLSKQKRRDKAGFKEIRDQLLSDLEKIVNLQKVLSNKLK